MVLELGAQLAVMCCLCQVGGHNGAKNIVKVLESRRVSLAFVLDEGLAVLDGVISGLQGPVAL